MGGKEAYFYGEGKRGKGGNGPLLLEILGQTDRVGAKSPIFLTYFRQ